MEYKINTVVSKNGLIEQTLYDPVKSVSRWVIDTREESVKRALCMLGWIPPKEEANS